MFSGIACNECNSSKVQWLLYSCAESRHCNTALGSVTAILMWKDKWLQLGCAESSAYIIEIATFISLTVATEYSSIYISEVTFIPDDVQFGPKLTNNSDKLSLSCTEIHTRWIWSINVLVKW